MTINRRSFLKTLGASTCALAATGIPLFGSEKSAMADVPAKKKAVVVVFLYGGFNALFSSAHSFLNQSFGVTSGNVTDIGADGLLVDAGMFGALSGGDAAAAQFLKQHTASVGIRHGSSDHTQGQNITMRDGGDRNYPIQVAAAMGGDAAIKAARIGPVPVPFQTDTVKGVSMQGIGDMMPIISALEGGAAREPIKSLAASAQVTSQKFSRSMEGRNTKSLVTVKSGHEALIATLNKAAPAFPIRTIPQLWGLDGTAINGNNMMNMMAGAELMIRTGTNVVVAASPENWDTHTDVTGASVRSRMGTSVFPAVGKFISRMMLDPATAAEYDVTVCFVSEFARSLPGSDHASILSSLLVGPRIKSGVSGRVDAQVGLAAGTPSYDGFWSLLAQAGGVSAAANPFGANPHAKLLT